MEHVKRFHHKLEFKIDNYLKANNFKKRPDASHGLWIGFLLPICLIISVYKIPTSFIYKLTCISSMGLAIETLLFINFIIRKNVTLWNTTIIPGLFTTFFCFIILDCSIIFSSFGGFFTSIIYKYGLQTILQNCPLCFTLGEIFLIAQAAVLFIYSALVHFSVFIYITPESDHDIITNILELGLLAVCFVVFTLFSLRRNMNLTKFTMIVLSYFCLMLLLLHITLQQSPLLWIIMYIFTDLKKILMIVYWASASCLAGLAIANQTAIGSKASTARRKIFHILAVAVYLPGIMFECNLIYLSSGVALAALIALESVRKLNLGRFSEILDDGFYVFSDEKDVGGISLTPIYLLLGLALSLFLHPSPCNHENNGLLITLCGILSVGVGDTAASYFGSKYGRHKWPGSLKSVEGTLASIILQCLIIIFISQIGFIYINESTALISFIAIFISTMVEAFTDQVDNLILPLITFIIFSAI